MVVVSMQLRVFVAAMFFLLVNSFISGSQAQDSDVHRDQKTNDFFGPKEELRRQRGSSRWRLPIELQRFRTIDGKFNNMAGIYWGSAGSLLRRRIPAAYADAVSMPAGTHRKPARSISNYMCIQNVPVDNARQMSAMVWQWGQFLDHDISLTESAEPLEPFPVLVPTGDRFFDPFGGGGQTISFFRSDYRETSSATMPREQVNSITSWIDGSNVYGSDDATAQFLRTLQGGLMKTSDGNLLPVDD